MAKGENERGRRKVNGINQPIGTVVPRLVHPVRQFDFAEIATLAIGRVLDVGLEVDIYLDVDVGLDVDLDVDLDLDLDLGRVLRYRYHFSLEMVSE